MVKSEQVITLSNEIKYIIFHPIQKYISSRIASVIINGIQIEKVHNFNFMGVCLDGNLEWDGHIKLLATKPGKYSGIWTNWNVTYLTTYSGSYTQYG